MVMESPERNQDFCNKCDEETIIFCPSCNSEIRGEYIVPGVISVTSSYSFPKYCYNCGTLYPWTKRILKAANELADKIEDLPKEEQDRLKKSYNDLVNEGSKTEVATTRLKNHG